MELENPKIAIVGLGYVGLPLAVAFSKKFEVVGYDISEKRVYLSYKMISIKQMKLNRKISKN